MTDITWSLRTFKIDELTDYFKNPRSLSRDQFEHLKTSLDKFGMIDKPIINADAAHTVIGGHQRLRVLRAQRAKEVECWYPSRELDAKEVEELNIRLNKNTGAWDFDVLANQWEVSELIEWGFEPFELGINNFPEVENDVSANTTKDGQYDKTKMPVSIGSLLLFMSREEQEEYSNNFSIFYDKEAVENEDVIAIVKQTVGSLADEIRAIVQAD